ncbi:MAG: porin family protein [Alphaproteobacteria bacterium]|nr:porin family protein [Alphaproteobacteria bacterium]MBQ9235669.1 porin family protein [Alphaproteobacteria bacterium]
MKKTLLLASAAACIFAFNANAMDLAHYAAARLTFGKVKVDASQVSPTQPAYNGQANIKDNTWGLNLAAGSSTSALGGALRAELEVGAKDGIKDDYTDAAGRARGASAIMKADIQTYMLNLYYDINTGTALTPYISGGIGLAHIKAKSNYVDGTTTSNLSKSTNEFAWQLGAGVSYALNDKVSIDLGYRYTDLGNLKGTTHLNVDPGNAINMKADFESHEVLLGVRYTF